jgi:hypothetical protein
MCQDHTLEPLPAWLQEELAETLGEMRIRLSPVRCSVALGLHGGCEHDPRELVQRFTVEDQELTRDALVIRSHLGVDMARMVSSAYSQEVHRAVRLELERRARAEVDHG